MARPVRRNIAHLTDVERTKYINAVAKADKRFWSGGDVSYWDFQDLSHQTTHVHGGPKFLLWHRELCNRYERLLQIIDPDVALHYWDWTTDPRSSSNGSGGTTDLSVDTFMGTMNGNVAGTLAPLHNGGQFNGSREQTGLPKDPPQTILRNLPPGPPAGADTDGNMIHAGDAFPRPSSGTSSDGTSSRSTAASMSRSAPGTSATPAATRRSRIPSCSSSTPTSTGYTPCGNASQGRSGGSTPRLSTAPTPRPPASTGSPGTPSRRGTAAAACIRSTRPVGLIQVKPYLDPSLVVPPATTPSRPPSPRPLPQAQPAQVPQRAHRQDHGPGPARRSPRLRLRHHQRRSHRRPAFTLHQASVQSPAPDDFTTTTVFLWVKYHAGAAGTTANGHLQATCPQTGTTIDVDIVADAITNPNVAVSAVLDSSGSMSSPSGVPGLDRMAVLHRQPPPSSRSSTTTTASVSSASTPTPPPCPGHPRRHCRSRRR